MDEDETPPVPPVEEEPSPEMPAEEPAGLTAEERAYNPFGDAWASARSPNPFIPVARTPGCHRRGPLNGRMDATAEELDFLAGSSSPIVFEECAVIPDQTNPRLRAMADGLRARDARIHYVGYHAPAFLFGGQAGYAEIVTQRPEWQVWRTDGTVARWPQTDGMGPPIVDLTNTDVRQFLARKIADSIRTHGMGGVMLDGVARELPTEVRAVIPAAVRDAWMSSTVDFVRDLKAAVGADNFVLVNRPLGELAYTRGLLGYADGVLLEDPMRRVDTDMIGTGNHAALAAMLDMTESMHKHAVVVVNTNVNGTSYSTTDRDRERAFVRYYLAAFLQFARSERTALIYYTPAETSPQFDASAHFRELDLRVGAPFDASTEIAPRVFRRKFENAHAIWNNSSQPYEVVLGDCCALVNLDGQRVTRQTLPPGSGMIFAGEGVIR